MLPQSNARITAINAAGHSEDYDQAGDAAGGSVKWSGDREAYVLEEWKTSYDTSQGSGQTRQKRVTMYLPLDMVVGFSLKTGDFITYTFNGQATTRRVQDATPNVYPGHPLQSYKLNLDAVAVETPA